MYNVAVCKRAFHEGTRVERQSALLIKRRARIAGICYVGIGSQARRSCVADFESDFSCFLTG